MKDGRNRGGLEGTQVMSMAPLPRVGNEGNGEEEELGKRERMGKIKGMRWKRGVRKANQEREGR